MPVNSRNSGEVSDGQSAKKINRGRALVGLVLSALTALAPASADAGKPKKPKAKQEQKAPQEDLEHLQWVAGNAVKGIRQLLPLKAQDKGNFHDGTKFNRWENADHGFITSPETDGGDSLWLMVETPESKISYFDSGANGTVESVLVNAEPEKNNFTSLDLLTPPAKQIKHLKTHASLHPQKVAIYYNVRTTLEGTPVNEVYVLDYTTGKITTLKGDEAQRWNLEIQQRYTAHVKGALKALPQTPNPQR